LSTEFGPERCCQPDRGPHCRRRTSDRPFHPATPAGEHCFTLFLALVLRLSGNWVGCGRGGRTVSNTPPRRREEWGGGEESRNIFFTHGMRCEAEDIHQHERVQGLAKPAIPRGCVSTRAIRCSKGRQVRWERLPWVLPTHKNVPSASQKSQEKKRRNWNHHQENSGNGPREDMTPGAAGSSLSRREDLLASPLAQPTARCVRLWPRIHRRRHGAPLGGFHVKRTLQNYFCAL
jgi:hypothetical protein